MADKYDGELDEILDAMQGYIDDDEIQLKVKQEAKAKLSALLRRVEIETRVDELKKMWGNAREHTITDIEMVMRHSGNTIDFIEGVDTRHFENRMSELQALLPRSPQERRW